MGLCRLQPKLNFETTTPSLRKYIWQTGDNQNHKTSSNLRDYLAATPGTSVDHHKYLKLLTKEGIRLFKMPELEKHAMFGRSNSNIATKKGL